MRRTPGVAVLRPHPYPAPAFASYICHGGVDFVTITDDAGLPFNELRAKGAKVPLDPESPFRFPQLATLHDARASRLAALTRLTPHAQVHRLEVFLDFCPRRPVSETSRQTALAVMQDFLLSRLYPWDGPGLQLAVRTYSLADRSEAVLPREWFPLADSEMFAVRRLPRYDETLYFGHAEDQHANLAQPHLAYMKLYRKVKDDGTSLPPSKWRIRVEVTLNSAGCALFGLKRLQDVQAFSFRRLAPYFQLVEPRAASPISKKALRKFPWLAVADEAARRAMTEEISATGAYTAGAMKRVSVGKRYQHASGNRKVGQMLDNLSRSFQRFDNKQLESDLARLIELDRTKIEPW
jgi:hypothetical protein